METPVTELALREGFSTLEQLADDEYHLPLSKFGEPDTPPGLVLQRVGRLIGVAMKQPFATPVELPSPSHHSRAYRTWRLSESNFDSPLLRDTWQFQTLDAIWRSQDAGRKFKSVAHLAREAHHEYGFFGILSRVLSKYICGDPKVRKKIETEIKKGQKAGIPISVITPETIVQAGGVGL